MIRFDELNVQKFSRKEIKNLNLVKNGNSGSLGTVYRLNPLECIKIYKRSKDEFELYRLNVFTKLKYEHIITPNRLAIIDNKFKGYTMDYIDGDMLRDCYDLDFSFLLNKYKEFIDNVIEEITGDGIVLYDCNTSNIMFDRNNKCFKLIDCDEWTITRNSNRDIIKQNYRLLNSAFNYFITDNELYDFFNFIDFYESYKEDKEKKFGIKIKTLGEFMNR